jgi:hypothetical protein
MGTRGKGEQENPDADKEWRRGVCLDRRKPKGTEWRYMEVVRNNEGWCNGHEDDMGIWNASWTVSQKSGGGTGDEGMEGEP